MIIIIGSVHLDIIGRIKGVDLEYEDYIGDVSVELGGQGYNILLSISALKVKPKFITYIHNKSIVKDVINAMLEDRSFLVHMPEQKTSEAKREGAYIGIFKDHKLIKSLIATPVESADLEIDFLNKNIFEEDLLILDGNCSIKTMVNSLTLAKSLKVHNSVCVVSYKKLYKILSLLKNNMFPDTLYFSDIYIFNIFKKNLDESDIDGLKVFNFIEIFVFDYGNLIYYNKGNKTIYEDLFDNKQMSNNLVYRDTFIACIEYLRDKNYNIEAAKKLSKYISYKVNDLKNLDIREDLSVIQNKSKFDAMTELYNKDFMMKKLDSSLSDKRNRNLCCMMLDIDKFKNINDTYGHAQGDNIIKELAYNLKKIIRTNDFAGRIGGDEFLLLFLNCNKNNIIKIYERILSSSDNYTCSIGVVYHEYSKSISSSELLKLVDDSLYKSKNNGRNQATFVNVNDFNGDLCMN